MFKNYTEEFISIISSVVNDVVIVPSKSRETYRDDQVIITMMKKWVTR